MATQEQPIAGAIISIYNREDYGVTGPTGPTTVAVADPKVDIGWYKAEDLDDGEYTYTVEAAGKGTLVGDFKLPGTKPTNPKTLPTIRMVSASDVDISIVDDEATPVVTGIKVWISRLYATHVSDGVYNRVDVPVGERLIEIVPDDPDVYQNLKILRTITSPSSAIDISPLYPPVTLYIKPVIVVDGGVGMVDSNARLFETTSSGVIIREITTKVGDHFKITHMANGVAYFKATNPTGTVVSDVLPITIDYGLTGANHHVNIYTQLT